ncbi:MAG: alpha-E domain-containing protein [Chloroflexi bacterium]|uniref:Alpha-E domain-containing protein n=1 Tax=Candidatus Chlorohelix allophototropha TaxID=3003348 RepID=A0A8T7MA75_9CHLR|nr:alpha-E domain-containing protein [Chloroflexota bacterium]WJW68824.1 alpha-E domain-containing protein [Chloroflexota bacterium L227-S17]
MLSRVAESMFWMSRYIERAENTARFLDVNFHLLLDLNQITQVDNRRYWEALIMATSDEARYNKLYDRYTADTVTDFLVFNRNNPNSILSCINLARENARSIIESISSEMWEQINDLHHFLLRATPQQVKGDPYNFYKVIKTGSQTFQGITDCTMSRSEAWNFVQAGKYVERADNTSRILDVKYHMLRPRSGERYESVDIIQWMAVLKSCSALEAFRKVHSAKIEPDIILHFLMLDREFPRSLYFSIVALEQALWRISGSSRRNYTNNADRLIGKMEAEMAYTTLGDIHERDLHRFLEDVQFNLARVGDQIHQIYFAYHVPISSDDELEPALPFTGLSGGRAQWSQAQQQQQQ